MKNLLNSFFSVIRTYPRDISIFLVFLIAVLILLKLNLNTQVGDNWNDFIIEHNCKEIPKRDSNDRRRTWKCDDGKEYYRWRQQM